MAVKLKKKKSKRDKSKSTWNSKKIDDLKRFFSRKGKSKELNLDNYFTKNPWKGLSFFIYFGHFVRIWNFRVALKGRKKPVLGPNKIESQSQTASYSFYVFVKTTYDMFIKILMFDKHGLDKDFLTCS